MTKKTTEPKSVLKDYDVKKVKKAIKEEAVKQHEISEKDQKIYEEMLRVADMPVVLENKDFKLGKQELDIRKLDEKNFRQMFFREQILTNIYSKATCDGITDVIRLLMILLDKLGVADIVEATDALLEKLARQQEEKAKKSN